MSSNQPTSSTFEKIAEHALALPVDQRVVLLHKLNDSLNEEEPTPEHQARVMEVVRQRAEEMRNGTAEEVSHEEVMEFLNRPTQCD